MVSGSGLSNTSFVKQVLINSIRNLSVPVIKVIHANVVMSTGKCDPLKAAAAVEVVS